jgi:predicted TIM-barrel fold metal-dependent hydrolase
MARIALDSESGPADLSVLAADKAVAGIRVSFRRDRHAAWLSDGTADWFWPAAAEAGLHVMVYAPGRLPQIAGIAAQYPDLSIIVDHLGLLPSARGDEREEQLRDVQSIAALSNVAVKVSALPLYSDEKYPHADIRPVVRSVIAEFGPSRSFWGSDLSRLSCTYEQAVEMVDFVLDGFTADEISDVLGGAILEWLKWK